MKSSKSKKRALKRPALKQRRDHPLDSHLRSFIQMLQNEARLSASTIDLYRAEIKLLLLLISEGGQMNALEAALQKLRSTTAARKIIIWRKFLEGCPKPWSELLKTRRLPKIRARQPSFLNEQEVFSLESACYKSAQLTRDRLLIGFPLQLGLRLSETLSLRFSNLEGEWLHLYRKGDKEQRLPIPPSLSTLIAFWRNERGAHPSDWIFPGTKNRESPLSSRAAQLRLKALAKLAGIQKSFSPHSLRHTFATQLASRGANLHALKELLGHSKISTTERYMHVTPVHLKETLGLLQKPLNQVDW